MGEHGQQDKREWYLPDRNALEPVGPYSTEQLIERIARGELRADEYVWGSHFTDIRWRRIAEVDELKPTLLDYPKCQPPKRSRGSAAKPKPVEIKFEREGEYGTDNRYRRYPRVPFAAEVIIHNQRVYRRGKAIDISENGISVNLDEPDAFEKGQDVVVTIRGSGEIGTFSATGAVVRIIAGNYQTGYGVSFLRLNPRVRRQISRYVLGKLIEAQGDGAEPSPEAA